MKLYIQGLPLLGFFIIRGYCYALSLFLSFSLSLSLSLGTLETLSVKKVSFKRTVQREMDIRAETSIELENGIHSFLTNMTKELNVNIDMVNKKYI